MIKDAYIEEIKHSLQRFAKTLDDTLTIAPELKKFMDENRVLRQKTNVVRTRCYQEAFCLGLCFLALHSCSSQMKPLELLE